jgi:glutathione synthase/RimK-type ligase-like ATP-grasp enzyme
VRPIDLLMPSPGDAHAALAAEQAEAYVAAFARSGLELRPRAWPEAGDAPALALFAWGYHLELERWLALLEAWPAHLPLFNPHDLLRWNTRKTYLAELEAAGVPTVPTRFGLTEIEAAFDLFGVDELIVKPQVSASSDGIRRLKRGDPRPTVDDAMVQPFLPSVQAEGEYALFHIDGMRSHAIRKIAATGEFRVQPQFGGVNAAWQPDDEAVAVAEMAIAAAPGEPLYARIDLLRRLDGRLAVAEFEAIEPDLYHAYGEGVLERLAEAAAARLSRLAITSSLVPS